MEGLEMHLHAACRGIDLLSALKFNGFKEQIEYMMQRVSGLKTR